ncbi:hypothetical protein JF50_02825 [Pseudoalteromonas luteoviolacea]|uniref:Uncharacterized protein n=1 Tax=Pseudoalteromonas luteoviolacea TaxID=43657 RepID=A0A0C1QV07_9GAMM|nr:hypothetical protein [Pseudoalteromonas luteoviolacea]KID58807.1 hypothetical protein JF50_02825 [Pseudoalteromonas luteoviolacea]
MKKSLITFLLFSSMSAMSAVGDRVTTQAQLVDELRVQQHESDAYYYVKPVGNDWLAKDCPAAQYAYIKESEAGAKMIMSMVISSKIAQKPVKFNGVCGDISGNLGYIKITDIFL